jgi:hypothetical protein
MPFPPSGTDGTTASKEDRAHYEVSGGDIARGFCLARMGCVTELVIVMSQAAEDTLDSHALLTVFYNNFTTLLRNLYDSVWRP